MKRFRLAWIRERPRSAPELPLKSPLQLGAISNGEIFRPDSARRQRVERLILERADQGARRLGIDRREFLASTMGMATSLWALNLAACGKGSGGGTRPPSPSRPDGGGADGGWFPGFGKDGGSPDPRDLLAPDAGRDGGYFDVPDDPGDPEQVCAKMIDASKEFIFDIQTHHVNRTNALYDGYFLGLDNYTGYCGPMGMGTAQCFDRNEYVRLIFLESDTTMAVLSGLPAVDEASNPITNAEIAETRDIINMLADGSQRLVNHHMVMPNREGITREAVDRQLAAMERTLDVYGKVGAWKCYPAWSPQNSVLFSGDGWFLDDEATGIRFLQKGLELGVGTFCIHKGLPLPTFSQKYNDPVDVGRAAKRFSQAKLIIYHSGFGHQTYDEGPYAEGSRLGTNSLITSLRENGIKPNANVYAELGTTWQYISTNPVSGALNAAAHVIGKLLKYVGEDNVVWGTDSIWYGSPQSQVESFLQFQISQQFQDMYGYPALTMALKRKILGLNAARAYGIDPLRMRCAVEQTELAAVKRQLDAERGGRRFSFVQPMVRSRRQFMQLQRRNNYEPG